jgi:hypothetical protein
MSGLPAVVFSLLKKEKPMYKSERLILTKTGHWYFYLLHCRRFLRKYPLWIALQQIAGCALIFAILIGLLLIGGRP